MKINLLDFWLGFCVVVLVIGGIMMGNDLIDPPSLGELAGIYFISIAMLIAFCVVWSKYLDRLEKLEHELQELRNEWNDLDTEVFGDPESNTLTLGESCTEND